MKITSQTFFDFFYLYSMQLFSADATIFSNLYIRTTENELEPVCRKKRPKIVPDQLLV